MFEDRTFSAAVDRVITLTKRTDKVVQAAAEVRSIIRRLQSEGGRLFSRDLTEVTLTATGSPFLWTLPLNFRQLNAVVYPNKFDRRNNIVVPTLRTPRTIKADDLYYYYMGGNQISFAGLSNGDNINVAYYEFLPRLVYYEDVTLRPARWDMETSTWSYATGVVDTVAAQEAVTHWILWDHFDLVVLGACARIYNLVGDEKGKTEFGAFEIAARNFYSIAQPTENF